VVNLGDGGNGAHSAVWHLDFDADIDHHYVAEQVQHHGEPHYITLWPVGQVSLETQDSDGYCLWMDC
jgi:hypothetical protein